MPAKKRANYAYRECGGFRLLWGEEAEATLHLALILHDEESTPGTVLPWCEARRISYEIVVAPREKNWNRLERAEGMVVCGGDMEVWEEEKFPWLKPEKKILRAFLQQEKSIFGICFGAQLLADQMGAEVKPIRPQIGWFPISLEGGGFLHPLSWHNSAHSLPEGAIRLASSPFVPNAGFREATGRAVGFQFHTEIDDVRLQELLSRWAPQPEARQQEASEIREKAKALMPLLEKWSFSQLDAWWQRACKKK